MRWLARAVAILALAAVAMAEGRAQGWILGEGANLNGVVLDRAHVGFGDRLYRSGRPACAVNGSAYAVSCLPLSRCGQPARPAGNPSVRDRAEERSRLTTTSQPIAHRGPDWWCGTDRRPLTRSAIRIARSA